MRKADLLIVMGTSLTVHPFASLAGMVDHSCPRVLINLDHVGDFGSRTDDVVLLGKCDDIVRDLCKELGWEDELARLWAETEDSVITELLPKENKPTPSKKDDVKEDALVGIEEQFTKLTVAEEPAGTLVKERELSESNMATSSDKPATISPVGAAYKANKAAHLKPRDIIAEKNVVDNKL